MKKKTTKKAKADVSSKSKSRSDLNTPKVKKASKKILSAAAHLKNTTKKMVDDVFLKVLGSRVLERAQEMTQSLHKEKSGKKGRK